MKTFKQLLEGVIQPNGTDKIKVEALKDACWKGYEAIGTKKKNGKEVPNCVPVKEETGNYVVDIHHVHPDGKKEVFKYKVGAAKSARHAKNIAMQKHEKKNIPFKNFGADSGDVHELKEGKMGQLHADIEDHLGKHLATYKQKGGAEHFGNKTVETAKHISKLHGISQQAAQKHVNDYVEHGLKEETLDEISKETLGSYVHKAFQHGNDLHYDIAHERDKDEKAKMKAKLSKRNTGVIKAAKKLREGTAMLSFDDFLKEQKACKKEELHPNQKKLDKNNNGKLDSDDFVKLRAGKKEVDEKYVSDAQRKAVWASKNEKGVKEETELDEATSPMQKLRDAHDRHMEKALAANKAGDDEATKVHQSYMQKITAKMNKLKQNEEIDLTEMENLCEISKATLGSYVKKAAYNAQIHAMASKDIENKEGGYTPDSLRHDFKRSNRRHGIYKAVNRLTKEEVEQIEELDKSTLGSYAKKSHDQLMKHTSTVNFKQGRGDSDAFAYAHDKEAVRKTANRTKGLNQAISKLAKEDVEQINEVKAGDDVTSVKQKMAKTGKMAIKDKLLSIPRGFKAMKAGKSEDDSRLKEETEEQKKEKEALDLKLSKWKNQQRAAKALAKEEAEPMLTFKQLMENISEAKIDDLKDRIAARKATQSAYDKDYKPAAKSSVTKVKGHSYGAGEEEGEDDEDDNKKVIKKPAAPVVKRGRGRPAGSKSGARR